VQMLETLLALGLGSVRWREQVESRLRRLARRKAMKKAGPRADPAFANATA